MSRKNEFDEIGPWSEVKLEILRKYAQAYSTIMANQAGFSHFYVDGFAGPGVHLSRTTGEWVLGSPLNALNVHPPFHHYFLVDLDGERVTQLQEIIGLRDDVTPLQGDCTERLLNDVFPRIRYSRRERALCVLDPYGLHLDWRVVLTAGQSGTTDLFLNFPIMDMNQNVLLRNRDRIKPQQATRMTKFWGDESWRDLYIPSRQESLFGEASVEKSSNEAVVEAYRARLKTVAGFKEVPRPMAMRNSTNAVVYYLFFASQKNVAGHIVQDIFRRYGA